MPAYDASQYDPPAPVARVDLRSNVTGALAKDVALLIDTGADVTLLPRSAVQSMGLQPVDKLGAELIGFDGSRVQAPAVELDMVFAAPVFRGRYLVIDSDQGILGRDVLASLNLMLDGPLQEWTVFSKSLKDFLDSP
jgi:hypothetical protein